jgi:hypothetical protein
MSSDWEDEDDDWLDEDEDETGLPALSSFRAAARVACASGAHSAAPSYKEALEKGGPSALHELGSLMLGELQQLQQLHAEQQAPWTSTADAANLVVVAKSVADALMPLWSVFSAHLEECHCGHCRHSCTAACSSVVHTTWRCLHCTPYTWLPAPRQLLELCCSVSPRHCACRMQAVNIVNDRYAKAGTAAA